LQKARKLGLLFFEGEALPEWGGETRVVLQVAIDDIEEEEQ